MSGVLVVEDERLVARDIERTLAGLGYQVAGSCATGDDALEKAVALSPDLVLMDIHLEGEIDGIVAARCIRDLLDLPVVYLSAYSDEDTVERAKQTGSYGYLTKPFGPASLRCAIEVALARHKDEHQDREDAVRRELELDAVHRELKAFAQAAPAGIRGHVDGLLRLSRISGAGMVLADVDLTALAESVSVELRKATPRTDVTLEVARGLTLRGDEKLLRLALSELLSNAWHFAATRIEVGKSSDAIFVGDDGPGFDDYLAPHLFEPFAKAGTGVGLATVKRVAALHGGVAWARSPEGKGATFYFTVSRT